MKDWLAPRWVAGAGFMAAGFLALAPLQGTVLPLAVFLVYLHMPVYMLHQIEEHRADRFRSFVNTRMFKGADGVTVGDVLVINLPIVWGVNLGALYAACAWGLGFALIAPYAMLVNAMAHFATSVRLRVYNPGLLTSAFLFVPLSLLTIWRIGALPSTSFMQQLAGLGLALLLHAAIIANALRRLAGSRRAGLTISA